MLQNKVYITIGRHERYGLGDTAILREDMLAAFQTGVNLRQILPPCACVYHSPLERAVVTAKFQALGLNCDHIIEAADLSENTPKYEVQKFFNRLLQYTDESVQYYHFVTHLPVVEKLGLPFLTAGEICLLTADNWQAMLSENFALQTIKVPAIGVELWQKTGLTAASLEKLSTAEIYALLQKLMNKKHKHQSSILF